MVGNIQNPVLEEFILLWDNPIEFTHIGFSHNPDGMCQMALTIEAPGCPPLQLPIPAIPRGNA